MIGGVAATAATQVWPFRVFSFPKELVVAPSLDLINETTLKYIFPQLADEVFRPSPVFWALKRKTEHTVTIETTRGPLHVLKEEWYPGRGSNSQLPD